jgi:MATE family multidrug resistance protein
MAFCGYLDFFFPILDIFFASVLDEACFGLHLSSHTQGLSTMDDSRKPQSWLHSLFRKSKASEAGASPDERTSLLPPAQHEEWSAGETYELDEGAATGFQLVAREFWVLLKGSIPVIVAYALQNSLQTISVLIVGRLSPEALATAAFSYMFAMATGWLIALGGTTAIDTLASASFTGSKDRHDLGIILQRSFIVLSLFYVPVAILWFCSAPLFRALGQEEYIARDSARFLSVLAPGGLGYIFFEAMKKYLQAQGMFFCSFELELLADQVQRS